MKNIIFFIIIGIIVLALGFIYEVNKSSNETVDLFEGYKNPIVKEGQVIGEGMITKGEILLPFDFLKEELTIDIVKDETSNAVILTTNRHVFEFEHESLNLLINEAPVQLSVGLQEKNGITYIPYGPLSKFYRYDVTYLNDSGVILLKEKEVPYQYGVMEKVGRIAVREGATIKAPIVSHLEKESTFMILDSKESFYFIQKEDGYFGYVRKKHVDLGSIKIVNREKNQRRTWEPLENIHLTFEAVYNQNPDVSKMKKPTGVHVVSPTWFELIDGNGKIKNKASKPYVDWAHKNNMKVWALFASDFRNPDVTHDALKKRVSRKNMIKQLLFYSEMYNLDGINIDFENVYLKDKENLVQFVRELTPILHQQNMVVSIDVTFISGSEMWSRFLDREKLGNTVDYMVVMAYDEHWALSPKAGSVSSLPWVESNLKKILKEVPREKLLLGIPFYMRVWTIDEKGNVSSDVLSMKYRDEWIEKKGITLTYNGKAGQHYGEYQSDGKTYKVWFEDKVSIKNRMDLVDKYNLKGVASWQKGFADEKVWKTIRNELK